MIGGFIITGAETKEVILRGLGPSLVATNPLVNPTLQLFNADGTAVFFNDNWRDTQEEEIIDSGVAPQSDLEAAMIVTLPAGNYTAVLQGAANTTGLALFEAYDLDEAALSQVVNLSTRGFVATGENVLIGGFIVDTSTGEDGVFVIRALGPSLAAAGVTDVLRNPVMELYSGDLLVSRNDNWQDDAAQAQQLTALGIAPTEAAESAIVVTLPPGLYTAVIGGVGATTGTALFEIYNVTPTE